MPNGCHSTPADHGMDSDLEDRLDQLHEVDLPQQARSSARLQQQRDVSALLGEKMLQGWTLLGDTCPRCVCSAFQPAVLMYVHVTEVPAVVPVSCSGQDAL